MIHNFWFGYWWPSVKGNGPEDITSLLIVTVIASLVIPAARRWWVAREQAVHAKLEHNAKLLAHIIRHSDEIPNHDRHGNLLVDVPLEPVQTVPPAQSSAKKVTPK